VRAGAAGANASAEDVAVLAALLPDIPGVAVRALVDAASQAVSGGIVHDVVGVAVAVAVGPLGGRPGCSSAAFPGPPAVGCCSLRRRAGSLRCRHATGTCSCRFAAFGIG